MFWTNTKKMPISTEIILINEHNLKLINYRAFLPLINFSGNINKYSQNKNLKKKSSKNN